MPSFDKAVVTLIACTSLASAGEFSVPDDSVIRRCQSHILIGDLAGAKAEATVGLKEFPDSIGLQETLITIFAKMGDDRAMMDSWDQYVGRHPDGKNNHHLLENMAWGVLAGGSKASSALMRTMAALGAFQGNDAKGVDILSRGLKDSNVVVRGVSVQLAAELGDQRFRDAFQNMLKDETAVPIRLELMRGLGMMHATEAKDTLMAIIADENSRAEEKAAAIEALVTILDSVDRQELESLLRSDRAGLRLLACEVIIHLALQDAAHLVVPLIKDHTAEVRSSALLTLGLLQVDKVGDLPLTQIVAPSLQDPDPQVAIAAAWLLTLHHSEDGAQAFRKWLQAPVKETQMIAAAALAATGSAGNALVWETFESSYDPYVRLNLALGLIGRRQHLPEASAALHHGLTQLQDRWCRRQYGIFSVVLPMQWQSTSEDSLDAETQNQLVRLELLNILALIDLPSAQHAIRNFLGTHRWGVTGIASLLLLQEGDETAMEAVRALLDDPITHIRVQAALALALWGHDPAALKVLEQAYPTADRELKEKILDAIGRLGSQESIPFLVERLKEPYQTLRLLAASGIVELLNH